MMPTLTIEKMKMLRTKAEELMKEIVLSKKYPLNQIDEVYNEIFGTSEKTSNCSSCIEQKTNRIKDWLKNEGVANMYEILVPSNELFMKLIKSEDSLPLGLLNGKMGLCLYLFSKSRRTSNDELEAEAVKILDNIIRDLKKNVSLDFDNGMLGIAITLDYLIKNKYMANDVNAMLKGTDDWIITRINNKNFRADSRLLLSLAYYFTMRLKDQQQGSDEEYIFREIIIKLVNDLHTEDHSSLFEEPFSFSMDYQLPLYIYILGKIYELGFYNYRIIKILEELSTRIITYIPLSHSHRLSLVCAMKTVTARVEPGGWDNHIRILKREIDIQHILNKELLNCHVGISDGVAGIYFLLKFHNQIFSDAEHIGFTPELFIERISSSEIWKYYADDVAFLFQNRGLANGLTGILLALDDMEELALKK